MANETSTAFSKEKEHVVVVHNTTKEVLYLLESKGLSVGTAKFILEKAIRTLDKSKMQAAEPEIDRFSDFIGRDF